MEALFRSLFTVIITGADTITMFMVSLNHLARGAAERTVIVEEKAVAAAALSQLEANHTVALRLQEILDANSNIDQEALDEARSFVNEYRQRRRSELRPSVVLKYKHTRVKTAAAPLKTKAKQQTPAKATETA